MRCVVSGEHMLVLSNVVLPPILLKILEPENLETEVRWVLYSDSLAL